MRYQNIPPITRTEAEEALASENRDVICNALVSLALHDPDWHWVQEHCLRLATHRDPWVKGAAAISLGHLARIHRILDLEPVLRVLGDLSNDSEVAGIAEDALADIRFFIGRK